MNASKEEVRNFDFFNSIINLIIVNSRTLIYSGPCQLLNIDLWGSDLGDGIKDIPSWYKCGLLCLGRRGCDSWNWRSDVKTCWLKKGVPEALASEGSISGTASCFNPTSKGILVCKNTQIIGG